MRGEGGRGAFTAFCPSLQLLVAGRYEGRLAELERERESIEEEKAQVRSVESTHRMLELFEAGTSLTSV